MTCRLATTADLPAIMAINTVAVSLLNAEGNFQWNSEYPVESDFVKDIRDGTLWVAVVDDVVAGYGALTTDQPDDYKNVGWDITQLCIVPHRVAVSPDFRGKGIAQKLLVQGEVLARERGYKEVRVDTNSINAAMNGVFKKMGYQFAGTTGLQGKPSHMVFNCYNKVIQ